MAARWGTGEEILAACNMDFFPANTLDESVLESGEALETLHSCLDPSIISMFEDAPTGELKGMDEESEATLLTALTEILDNVDDENLSPFDMLPDSDLLSSQKGREHSPLRRLLCLSRSPPEKDSVSNSRPFSAGKNLPRIQPGSIQRSDGEEEEDLSLSPTSLLSSPDRELLDWAGLTLPHTLALEGQEGDGFSMSLGDLVRHMHPYCMAVSVEDGTEEDLLPEGGILLEVVDQGEHGEPILAIPDMGLPFSLPELEDSSDKEAILPEESCDAVSDESDHIVVDDDVDDAASKAPVAISATLTLDQSSEDTIEKAFKRPKEEMRQKSPSRKKRKKKNLKEKLEPKPVEGKVLRSSSRKAAQETPQKPPQKTIREKKRESLPPKAAAPTSTSAKHKKLTTCQAKIHPEVTTLTLPPQPSVKVMAPVASTSDQVERSPELNQSNSPSTVVNVPQPLETQTPEKLEVSSATAAVVSTPEITLQAQSPSPDCPTVPLDSVIPRNTTEAGSPVASQPPEVVVSPASEPKPKPLSLAEYRRLRQQKKPAPVEKQEDHSTKWPSLPELPKELPPIPCLPDPSPKDTRRPHSSPGKKNEEVEVKTAWQPMGPGAPPTPEALLVPPAYMVASSTKNASATTIPKPQQVSVTQSAKPSQPSSTASPDPVKSVSTHTSCLPAKSGDSQSTECVPAPQPVSGHISRAENQPSAPLVEKPKASEKPQPVSVKPLIVNEVPFKATTEPHSQTTTDAPAQKSINLSEKLLTASIQKTPVITAVTPLSNTVNPGPSKPTIPSTQPSTTHATPSPIPSQNLKAKSVMAAVQMRPKTTQEAPKVKSATQELIEAFTSEIGIEAADLTSLLEQFEETQAKEEQSLPEVCGRAAAVGNSSVELPPEKTAVERVKAHDLSSTAGLTPPATPPHMWKPLAPVALLAKNRSAETSKPSPSKVIQIDPRPLPSAKLRNKSATATIDPSLACMDHDYCLPSKEVSPGEQGKRWNVKQQPSITIKTIQRSITQQPASTAAPPSQPEPTVVTKTQGCPLMEPLDHRTESSAGVSVLETPDASPTRQEDDDEAPQESPRRGPSKRSYRRHDSSRSRSPSPRPKERERKRGRSRSRRRSHRSVTPGSSSSGSRSRSSSPQSRSRSPPKKRYRQSRSRSSSSNSSRSSSCSSRSVSCSPPRRRKHSYSSSRSGSWSRSRSRSPCRRAQWGRSSHRPSYRSYRPVVRETAEEVNRRKEKAIEERRVVYVGRIRGTMTRKELRDRFSLYGEIEECTLHFRDHGDNYGFVTYYDTKDAFTAIENGGKLRNPDELPFDLCFGGRRQFCQTSYSDLDSNREYDPSPAKGKFHALDFDTLLKQAQKNLKR